MCGGSVAAAQAAVKAAGLNLTTKHGRAIARARFTNPDYVIPPSPPPDIYRKETIYQQAYRAYQARVHELRIGYQKQHQLIQQNENAAVAKRYDLILASKERRRQLVKYEKAILNGKRQEEAIKLAQVKDLERKQHAINRRKIEHQLRRRKVKELINVLKESESHWEDKKHRLTPHLFDKTYLGLTGFWVNPARSVARPENYFINPISGNNLKPTAADEWALIDYRSINYPKTTYVPSDVSAPQFKRSAADRVVVKQAKKAAKLAKEAAV